MQLSVIIVNYNSGALTRACVESLFREKVAGGLEIIIIDNASRDDSVAFLRSDFPEVTVIANPHNVGLAAAVNQGLAKALGNFVLLLNPDIIVLPGALQALVAFMQEHKDVGVAGGQLLSPNGRVQYSCFRFYTPGTILYRRTWLGKTKWGRQEIQRFLMKDFNHASARDVDWLMGSCLCLRRTAVEHVGGMDERFFLYFEDVDWCRRFWHGGWRVTYVPQAQFSHYHQQSSRRGALVGIFTNWTTREHILSALKYFYKYRGVAEPRIS